MRLLSIFASLLTLASATILQNGQIRKNPYPGQPNKISMTYANKNLKAYSNNASELSYKGRWDSNYISWWSAPGLKFGYTGSDVAVTFGPYTTEDVLLAWRIAGQDWSFANVTANATYHFVDANTPGQNSIQAGQSQSFEFYVTNWAYGVQVEKVWVGCEDELVQIPDYPLMIQMIGDSLTSGYTATYEGISSYGWGLCAGLGNVEFSITAYPGICLNDQDCWGNPRGQTYQWLQTSDTSPRAQQIYGTNPVPWDFKSHQDADVVVINLGTNDSDGGGTNIPVSNSNFTNSYIELIKQVHERWPKAQVVAIQIWEGFYQYGNSYYQDLNGYQAQILEAVNHFATEDGSNFVYYFNTTGILTHNDVNVLYHPTDVGHIKIASHLMQFIKLTFGWVFGATGPEVFHGTDYYNNMPNY